MHIDTQYTLEFCLTWLYFWWIAIVMINPIQGDQIQHILIVKSNSGVKYSPVNVSAQFISTSRTGSFMACLKACNMNSHCGVVEYGVNQTDECSLYEGDTSRLGSIVPSPTSPQSLVGTVRLSPYLFTNYGQPCLFECTPSRYLQCGSNGTCECLPHMYWDPSTSMCLVQFPLLGGTCEFGLNMCRTDLGYSCLQFNQCGPLSLLQGTTLADQYTSILNSSPAGLQAVAGIIIVKSQHGTLVVLDQGRNEILLFQGVDSGNITVSRLIKTWTDPVIGSFGRPAFAQIYPVGSNNLYVADYYYDRVILFSGMQTVNPLPVVVAGVTNSIGLALNHLNQPAGIAFDQSGNLIVADRLNNRVMLWLVNATAGIMIAGSGVAGNGPQNLYLPYGVYFDERDSSIYVVDQYNHRVVRIPPTGSYPRNVTTVAGGNGMGSGSDQLNYPSDVWISKKTGAIYIVDGYNSRIQRWEQNATTGVTVFGSLDGISGTSSTLMWAPQSFAINDNETIMYVTDQMNQRVLSFNMI